ncbi:cellulose biosynthesis cyclic di-GMP-binding regulatory protein BcsB [Paenibacillus tritici]|uniref:Cellulose biosynthesis cyclic di-GMP-binding regulatory protein BcsB n=1 Tax=Paenibacillus tritici TaxID=1873425 RepID=A0ABX2DNY3_9BACL|nr:cellulose biosynthesis cyclic di-GMP-binding regulatory protein BcsB [Paenibacillus tritici]NQX46363.1 cellulose biosynthesis cyclic di-GMP-binding regulatory protein BcsB [Paenibacillus tritici]
MMKKQIITLLLCLSLFLVQMPAAHSAALPGEAGQTYETSFTGGEISLKGSSSQQQFFTVMEYWNIDKVMINLHFQASQINEDTRSSVTLSLNGIPFHSFRPSRDNNGQQSLSVEVPKGFVTEGTNTLGIQGNLRTDTGGYQLCNVDDMQDSWLHLFNTSNIAVKYTTKAITGGIQDFSSRFSGMDTVKKEQSLLTVPQNASGAELESATYALSGFVKGNTLNDTTIPLLPYRESTVEDKRAVVLVAMYDHLPDRLKKLVSTADDLGTHAVIQLVDKESQPTLIVTSKDESLLIKAGRLMASRTLMSQISKDLKVVDGTTHVVDPAPPISTNITFTDTGDKLTGPNHQEQTYFVSLPSNRSIADDGKISLDFRYAANLDFNRSLVTVSINNTPIGSKKLTKELANGDVLNLNVPQSLNISGNFTVTVAFELELASILCTPNRDEMPWAYISKESLMRLNTKDRTDLLLGNYPYPFLRDGIFNRVAVVLPKEKDDYTYRSLGNIFNMLGKYAGGNTGDVHYYSDNVTAGNLKDNNIIAIGTYKDNKVIRDNNDKLFFKYNKDGSTLLSNEKLAIEEKYGAGIGTLQLLESPYEGGRGLLAVTAVRSESNFIVSKLIGSEKDRWKVYGDGVVADKDGTVNAYRFKTITGAEPESLASRVMERTDVLGFVTAAVLMVALVVVALLLLLRKHKKKRGDQA